MSNKYYKKITILIAVMLIIFIASIAIKSNFSHDSKYDELSEMDISSEKEIEEVTAKNIFSPDNKAKDKLTEYKNPRAKMILSLPSDWAITWLSDREITGLTSKNSKIPNTSFFISYDFGAQNVKSGKELIDTFKNELYKKTYKIDGKKYNFFSYEAPEIKTDSKFTNKHDNLVACAVTKNIRMKNDSSVGSSKKGFTKIDYYVNWYKVPCVISCVVKSKDTAKAKDLLQTIVSNIKYCKQNPPKTGKTASLYDEFNFQLKLPHQFQPAELEDEYLVYRADIDNASAYSGMSLLRIKYDNETSLNIDENSIAKEYALSWFKGAFADSSYITPVFYASESGSCEINKNPALVYDVDYTIIAKKSNYESYFVPGETWKMKVFAIYGEKESEYIILNYQECQEREAKEVLSLFVK